MAIARRRPLATATFPTSGPAIAATAPTIYDIFISLRFSEAMEAAAALKVALEGRDLSVFLCDVQPGLDIAQAVIGALSNCKLAVILGTKTYGTKTKSKFSTFQELNYIIEYDKPYFLIKMCDNFEVDNTQFHIRPSVSYFPWQPKTPSERKTIPRTLVDQIVQRHRDVVAGRAAAVPTTLPQQQPQSTQHVHSDAAQPSSAMSSSQTSSALQGFKDDLARFLVDKDFDANEDLIKALTDLGVKSMGSVKYALNEGLITVDELKDKGCRPVPASQFVRAAKAHFGLQ
jgi:hypothetical protein